MHYYFYFNDPDLGFGYMRVPTWCPFQLQVYFNGHNILVNELSRKKIGFSMVDNAFDYIENFAKAQKLADSFDPAKILKKLTWLAGIYCPVYKEFDETYHWSIMQQEYATDIVLESSADLKPLYDDLIATAIHTVKPANIATFFHKSFMGIMKEKWETTIIYA